MFQVVKFMQECVLYSVQNIITKSTMNQWVQRLQVGQTSMSDKPQSGRPSKRRSWCGMSQALTNSLAYIKNASLDTAIMSKNRL